MVSESATHFIIDQGLLECAEINVDFNCEVAVETVSLKHSPILYLRPLCMHLFIGVLLQVKRLGQVFHPESHCYCMCSYCYGDLFASSSDLTHIQTNVLITAACAEIPGKDETAKKKKTVAGEKKVSSSHTAPE